MRKQLDQVFEIIVTGVEMIDAVVEAHRSLYEAQGKDDPKTDHPKTDQLKYDHPATFALSLQRRERS